MSIAAKTSVVALLCVILVARYSWAQEPQEIEGLPINLHANVTGVEEGKLPPMLQVVVRPHVGPNAMEQQEVVSYKAKVTNLVCNIEGPPDRPTFKNCVYNLATDRYVNDRVAELKAAIKELDTKTIAHATVQQVKAEYEDRLATMKSRIEVLDRRLADLEVSMRPPARRKQ